MKPHRRETHTVHMPPELLEKARKAAVEEKRPTDELVSDAVRQYLQHRASDMRPTAASPWNICDAVMGDGPPYDPRFSIIPHLAIQKQPR